MRFALTADQRDHFVKHGYVEFEEVVPPNLTDEQLARRRPLAEVAAELTGVRPLRLGWTKRVTAGELNLKEMGSVQGIVAGAIIKSSGEAIFFSAEHSFSLAKEDDRSYLLIAYAGPRAVYVFNEHDPDTHLLKRQGYVFGDRLREEIHPTLTR